MDRTQRNQMTLKQRLEFRKFKMLKLMVMYLQQIPLFGKYCFYGCYCFPNMGQDFTVGKGKPMDEVDSKCRDFSSQGCKMDCEKLRICETANCDCEKIAISQLTKFIF